MGRSWVSTAPPAARPLVADRRVRVAPLRLRSAFLLALVSVFTLVLALTLALSPPPAMGTELQRLLRVIVGIKGLFALIAAGLVLWRLGGPIERLAALGYGVSVCLAAGAVAWLWGLQAVPLGGLLFWAGLGGAFAVAQRDRLLGEMPRAPTRRWPDAR